MTYAERLQRIGEHAQKWVRLEAEKEAARKENARAWRELQVIYGDGDRLYSAVERGIGVDGKRGYFWTSWADRLEGGGQDCTRADSDPRVQNLVETWAAYSKAKQAAGRARAVVTKACRALEKAK